MYCIPRVSCDYLYWSCDIRRSAVLTESGSTTVAKQDLQFKLKVTVTLHDLTAIPSNENRPLFCVFEVCVCVHFYNNHGVLRLVISFRPKLAFFFNSGCFLLLSELM